MLPQFLLFILFSLSVDSLLINLKKSCVPSQIAKGPCHRCVCNIEGLFKCQSITCQNETIGDFSKLKKEECQPMMTYQYEDLYCTCNFEGKWMSYNCRDYFKNITLADKNVHKEILRTNFDSHTQFSKHTIKQIRGGDNCVPGNVYKLFCNTCQCGSNNALTCTKMLCLNSTIKEEIESIKKKKNKATEFKRRNVPRTKNYGKIDRFPKIVPPEKCVPGKLYINGCHKCLCRHNQVYICTKKCRSSVPDRVSDYEILQLDSRPMSRIQKLPHVGSECDPGKTYAVTCNLCYCTEKRDLVCTFKYCLNVASYADIQANKLTGTPCTKDYIKQCANCKCVDRKSECTKLKACVTDMDGKLLTSADNTLKLSLDATKEKCVPGASYKVHCNYCFCQSDGSLRCTQKTCLTHSQAKELNEMHAYLEKHGL